MYEIANLFSMEARKAAATVPYTLNEAQFRRYYQVDECYCPIGYMAMVDNVVGIPPLTRPSNVVYAFEEDNKYSPYELQRMAVKFIRDWDDRVIKDIHEALGVE